MKIKNYKAWFQSELSLKEIAELFKHLSLMTDYYYDYENVYEWFEANTLNTNIKLNISRKHNNGTYNKSENISILVMYEDKEPKDSLIDKISNLVSKELKLTVYSGKIRYLGNDDYKYVPKKTFS